MGEATPCTYDYVFEAFKTVANDLKRLSKFLAVVLRHSPEDFDIELDEQGYAPLDSVWTVIQDKYGNQYDMSDLEAIVAGDSRGKKRYEIIGEQIRAMYGHSKPKVIYPACEPPELLYHGTNGTALKTIRTEGLQSLSRQYVHLTSNLDNATVVAKRKTRKPIILVIRAMEAYHASVVFHQPESQHYLAKAIPAQFIDIPE